MKSNPFIASLSHLAKLTIIVDILSSILPNFNKQFPVFSIHKRRICDAEIFTFFYIAWRFSVEDMRDESYKEFHIISPGYYMGFFRVICTDK